MSADYQGEIRAGAGRGAGEDIALRCDRALRTSDELAKLPELRWTSNGARGCSACVATLPQVGAATVAARAGVAPGQQSTERRASRLLVAPSAPSSAVSWRLFSSPPLSL